MGRILHAEGVAEFNEDKMAKNKMKTKSTLKKRARMTASGLVRVKRTNSNHFLRKRAKRAIHAGRKTQYVNENMTNQIKKLAPYGLRD